MSSESEADANVDTLEKVEQMDFLLSLHVDENTLVKSIRDRIKKMRGISKYFANSPKGSARLKSIQTGLLNMSHALGTTSIAKRDGIAPTVGPMLCRLLKLRKAIDSFFDYIEIGAGKEFTDFKLTRPTSNDWFVIDALSKTLAPFLEATEVLSGEKYPTMLLVFPVLRSVKKRLDPSSMRLLFERMRRNEHRYRDINVLHLMVSCASYLRKSFLVRFTGMDSTLVWIAVLNPIFVKLNHLSDTEKEVVRSKVIGPYSRSLLKLEVTLNHERR